MQHGRCDGIRHAKGINSFYKRKVFSKNTENEKDAMPGIRNDGVRKNVMGVSTAFTNDSGYTDILIDRLAVDEIDDGSGIRSMGLAVSGRICGSRCRKTSQE